MSTTLISFGAAFVLLLLVDAVWLLVVGPQALAMTAAIQGSPVSFRILPAVVVYVALAYLVQLPSTMLQAALMGAAVYAVYDFTSLSILKKFSPWMAVADTMWGGVLFATVFAILRFLPASLRTLP
jgi:uncharacterized membrane protein